jgi:Lar family restriction alleviation protein
MANEMSELLPCPFCGELDAEIEYVDHDISFYVECKVCLACGPIIHSIMNNDKESSKIEAIGLWNKRVIR